MASNPDCIDREKPIYLILSKLGFTSNRTEACALMVGSPSSFEGIKVEGQTMFFDIPIIEDDDLSIFNTIKSRDNKKHQQGIEEIKEIKETLAQPKNWNDKILDLETSPSRKVNRIINFTDEVSKSSEFGEEITSKAKSIREELEEYDLSDYFEDELDKILRKRNRPNWGWKRTIEELYAKLKEFELGEEERVEEVDIILTERLDKIQE